MGSITSLLTGPLKFWIYGTFFLALISVSLGVAFSGLVSGTAGLTIGIVSTDAGDIAGKIEEGKAAAGEPAPAETTD